MNFDKLTTPLLNDPKRSAAILLFFLAAILFGGEIFKLWQAEDTSQVLVRQGRTEPVKVDISANSALFKIPLFGQYVPNIADMEIKQSSLDLEIVGIMYSNNPESSQVLIRAGEGEELSYGMDDELPGGAVIKKITKNGIVVFYHGSLESLSLPKTELLFEEPAKPLIEE